MNQFAKPAAQVEQVFPEAMTLETIEMLEQAAAMMFHGLRRNVARPHAQQAGAVEYDSWSNVFDQ
jgi:hypothetical protein